MIAEVTKSSGLVVVLRQMRGELDILGHNSTSGDTSQIWVQRSSTMLQVVCGRVLKAPEMAKYATTQLGLM
jgi:hypothetical protein